MELFDDAKQVKLAKLLNEAPDIPLTFTAVEGMALVGNLLIALEHPENASGLPADVALATIEVIKRSLPPLARLLIEREQSDHPFIAKG